MAARRPRIEGYAVISTEGMIATSDGSFPEPIKIPAKTVVKARITKQLKDAVLPRK